MSIILGTIVVSSAAFYFLANDLSAQSEKIISDKAFVAQQTAILGALASLKSDASSSVPYADAMNKLLPTHDELIGFPQWISALAREHNVSVSVVFSGRNLAATASSPGTDGFSMTASGTSGNLAAFLDDIEAHAPGFLLTIDTFDLASNGSAYQLSAQGKLFSRPSQQPSP